MVSLFKKSSPFLLLLISACGKNFALDDFGLSLASLGLNPQTSNNRQVTLSGACSPSKGNVTISSETDLGTTIDYFAPSSQEVDCKASGTFSADVTLSVGDGLKNALIAQGGDKATGSVRLDMTSPDRVVVTSPVNGEKITTTNLLQNLLFKVTGTGEEKATVKVTSLSSSCSAKVNASGAWECLLEPALPNGVHPLNVTQVDLAGNTSAVNTILIEVISNGGVTPASPSILTPISGSFLKDIEFTLTGQCDSSASVVNITGSVVDDSLAGLFGNKSIIKTTCTGANTYSVPVKFLPGDGAKSISVSQIVDGSASYPSTATYILDTEVPLDPTITSPLASSSLVDTTPIIRGIGVADSTIRVKAGVDLTASTQASCETTVAANGSWFCELQPSFIPPVEIDIEVVQKDRAGNESAAVTVNSVTLDPTLIPSPTINSPAFGSTLGTLTQTITGSCVGTSTVALLGNIEAAVSGACTAGSYSLSVDFVAGEGSKMLQATQTNSSGETSLPSVVHYFVDSTPPEKPVVTSPASLTYVNNNQTEIKGTGAANSTVTVTVVGGTPASTATCQATVNNSNNWSCTLGIALNDGLVEVVAFQTDSAGNVGLNSDPLSYTIDTSIPSSVTIDDPASGAYVKLAAQTIKGTCTSGFMVELKGNIVGSPKTGLCSVSNNFEIDVDLSKENKLNNISALQINLAGTSSPAVVASYTWDTNVPDPVDILSPPNNATISDKTPNVSGLGEAGATVHVSSGASTCTSLVNPNKTWSCDLSTSLSDGPNTISAYQEDLAGNQSNPVDVNIAIDPNAAAAPLILSPASGSTLASEIQNISVSCLVGSTVKLAGNFENSPKTESCDVSPKSISVTFVGGEGPKSLQATQIDGANVESTPSMALYVLDTSVPSSAPTIESPVNLSIFQIANPSVWGSSEASAKIKVKSDGVDVCNISADSSGKWFCPATSALSAGSHILTATQTDSAGNESSDSTAVNITVDLANPSGLTIAAPTHLQKFNQLDVTVSGQCEAYATVTLTGSFAESPASLLCQSTGDYLQIVNFYPGEGLRSVQAIQTDASGRTQGPVKRYLSIDSTPPLAPYIASPSNNSFVKTDKPIISGTGEAGASIEVRNDVTSNLVCSATVNSSGNWSCDVATYTLLEGEIQLAAKQSDSLLNESGDSNVVAVTVDLTSPDAPDVISPVHLSLLNTRAVIVEGSCEDNATVSVGGTGINPRPVSATCVNESFAISVMLTSGDADKFLSINQKDRAGNESSSALVTYTLKSTLSVGALSVANPIPDSILDSDVQSISGDCDDGTKVYLYGSFVEEGTNSGSGPFSVDCASGVYSFSDVKFTSSNGIKNIYVQARDLAGNASTFVSASYTLDTVSPTVSLNALAKINSSNLSSYDLSGTCSDNGREVVVVLEDDDTVPTQVTPSPNPTCTAHVWSVKGLNLSSLLEGDVTVKVSQEDAATNQSIDVTAIVQLDKTAPDLTLPTIADITSLNKNSFDFEGTCTAGDGNVSGTLTDGTNTLSYFTNCEVGITSDAWSVSGLNVSNLKDGVITVSFVQTDSFGNQDSDSVTTNKVTVGPTVIIEALTEMINNTNKGTYAVTGTCAGTESVTVSLSDGKNSVSPVGTVSCGDPTTDEWTATVDVSSLRDGLVTVNASQEDAAGNVGHATAQVVEKDTVAPVVRIGSLDPISGVNEGTYTVSGTCSVGDGSVTAKFVDAVTPTANEVEFIIDCNAAGEWSDTVNLTSPIDLIDGDITVSAKQTDTAGNEGNAAIKTVVMDTSDLLLAVTAPSSTKVNQSNYESFALTGTCEAVGQSVDVTPGTNTSITPDPTKVLCGPGGTWIAYLNFKNSDTANTGNISVDVNHSDAAGNAADEATQALTFDITPPSAPTITLSSPVTSPGSDSTPALTVTATAGNYESTDKLTLHLVAGCVDTAVSDVAIGDGATGSVVVSAAEILEEGQVLKYYARVEDDAGNSSCSSASATDAFVTYKLDTVAPVVRIGSLDPISGENANTYIVSGTCSVGDGDVTGKLVDTTAPTAKEITFSTSCNSAGEWVTSVLDLIPVSGALKDGTITVSAKQTDEAANEGTATEKTVNKDTAGPTLAITTDPGTIIVNKTNYASFDVTGTCEEIGRDVVVSAGTATTLKYGDMTVKCLAGTWIANLNFTGTDSTVTQVSINVNHSDAAGNAATPANVIFDFDIVDPVVSVASLPVINNANYNIYAVSGSCQGTESVTVSLSDGKNSVSPVGTITCGLVNPDEWTATVDVSSLRDGLVTVNASQEDAAENVGHATAQVVEKDTVAPVVRIGSLDPISDETSYTVSGTCSVGDGNVSGKLVDGAATPNEVSFDVDCNAAGEWSDTLNLATLATPSDLEDGDITVSAKQTDVAGNESNAAIKTVNKDIVTLVSLDNSDDAIGFGGGTESNVEWDSTNNYLKLTATKTYGVFTSRVMDFKSAHSWTGLNWKTTMPFGKELTNASELATNYSGVEADLMSDVVAIWHMNDDVDSDAVADATVTANNLALNGDVLLGESGKLSKSVRFNDGYLSKAAVTNSFQDSFTIQAWVKADYSSLVGGDAKIIFANKVDGGGYYFIALKNGKAYFEVSDGSNVASVSNPLTLVRNKWYHLVAVLNATDLEIYVNKDPEGEPRGSVTLTNSNGGLFIGGHVDISLSPSPNFSGVIDEVALWSEALSQDKITQLYRRGVNRLKFQVRGCYNSSCSGAGWVGPSGTSSSYFSELINNAEIDASTLDPLEEVSALFPAFSFADYLSAGLNEINSQYIQYRAIFETDDPNFSPELKQVEIEQ